MATYKAYIYESFGGDALQQIKLSTSVPFTPLKTTAVRIKVASAAINPVDWKLIQHGATFLPSGPTPENPFRIGFDVSGQIIEAGADVESLKVGDLVYARAEFMATGTVAEFIDIEEKYVAPKPKNLSHDEAAAVPLVALTSYQALVQYSGLKAGQRVLILGASGGCGIVGVQIAKALGAHVIATASFRNIDFVKSLGADQVIDYTTTAWSDVVVPHSLDVIYDCGFNADAWTNEAQRFLKQGSAHFVTLANVTGTPIESPVGATLHQMITYSSAKQLEAITKYIEEGKLHVNIEAVYPFGQFMDAMERLKTGRVRGKLVIKVDDL